MSINTERTTRFTEADFDGSNAAPLLIIGPEARLDLIDRQDRLADNFQGLAYERLSDIVDPEVVAFVATSIRNRMHQREGQNSRAYLNRLSDEPNASLVPYASQEQVLEACEKAKIGEARLAQHAISAAAWIMYEWEGKNLTIVDEARKELETPMWDEVSEFTGVDATPRFTTMRGFKVHQFVGGETSSTPIKAMRVEMKRTIKELEDGTKLKARTSAIINTSRSPLFNARDVREIYDAYRAGENMDTNATLLNVVEQLVDGTLPRGIALARNETIYGYNPDTEQLFIQRRSKKKEEEDALFHKRNKNS